MRQSCLFDCGEVVPLIRLLNCWCTGVYDEETLGRWS